MDMLISSAVSGKLTYHKQAVISAVIGKLSSAGELTYHKQAVISCHIRQRGSTRKKFSFDRRWTDGLTDRQITSAGLALRFTAKKMLGVSFL